MTLRESYESIIREFDLENQHFYYKVIVADLYIVLKLIYII